MQNQLDRWMQELNWCGNGLRSVRSSNGDSSLDELLANFDDMIEDLLHCSDHITTLLLASGESATEDTFDG